MREYVNREYARNQRRSAASDDVKPVLKALRAILRKYRRAVLHGDRAGIRAFGKALREFGGRDAEAIGYFTLPMNGADFPGFRVERPGRWTSTKAQRIADEEWRW